MSPGGRPTALCCLLVGLGLMSCTVQADSVPFQRFTQAQTGNASPGPEGGDAGTNSGARLGGWWATVPLGVRVMMPLNTQHGPLQKEMCMVIP
jgi:hypothetical protein